MLQVRGGSWITTLSSQLMSVRRPARTPRAPDASWPGSEEAIRSNRSQRHGTSTIMPDNAYIEAFNGRFRAECLKQHWFLTLADAAEKLEGWRRYYNEERPHGAIGNKVPISFINPDGATGPPS